MHHTHKNEQQMTDYTFQQVTGGSSLQNALPHSSSISLSPLCPFPFFSSLGSVVLLSQAVVAQSRISSFQEYQQL